MLAPKIGVITSGAYTVGLDWFATTRPVLRSTADEPAATTPALPPPSKLSTLGSGVAGRRDARVGCGKARRRKPGRGVFGIHNGPTLAGYRLHSPTPDPNFGAL